MRLLPWLLAAGVLAACTQQQTITRLEPASFQVKIVCAGTDSTACPAPPTSPGLCPTMPAPQLGTPEQPVDRSQRYYLVQAQAIGSDGQTSEKYNATANVYAMFNSSVTPPRDSHTPPLATMTFANGVACAGITIPPAFNDTYVWIEDPTKLVNDPQTPGHKIYQGSFAVGSSQTIYRPAPLISDVQTTTDVASHVSPLNLKHVLISSGTNGAPLVVTSISSQYFTVSDTGAPGTDHPWSGIEVYSYSQPVGVQVGTQVRNVAGAVSMFHGLVELNFPTWDIVDAPPDPTLVPAPHELTINDFTDPSHMATVADWELTHLKAWDSSLVSIKGWQICALTGRDLTSYQKYNQWKLGPANAIAADGSCQDWKSSVSVTTNLTIPSFDPMAHVGKKLCSVQGIWSHVIPAANIYLWNITPRNVADLGTPVDTCP